jgi:hypothetical protein
MNTELQQKAEAILEKHLQKVIDADPSGYHPMDKMKLDPEWFATLAAMEEMYQLALQEREAEVERQGQEQVMSGEYWPPISESVNAVAPYEDMNEEFKKGFDFCISMVKDFESKVQKPSPAPQQEVSTPEVEATSLPLSQAWGKGYETATLKLHPIIQKLEQRIAELEAEKLSFHKDLIAEQNKNISLRAKLEAQPSPPVELTEFIRRYVDIDSLDEPYVIGIEELTKAALSATPQSSPTVQEDREVYVIVSVEEKDEIYRKYALSWQRMEACKNMGWIPSPHGWLKLKVPAFIPSTEQADSRNQWVKHFNPPFKHAEDSTFILDSHGNIVIEVRGWGHLSNLMTDIKACEVQDQIANHITDILNSSTEHKKEGGGQ